MELLQGRVAGLNVQQNNGAPGSIGTYTIRGISDISVQGVGDGEDEQYILGSSAPLFVIDGIPQEDVGDYDANGLLSGSGVSPLSSLPFEDIEDITVLKDAAATAQYGSRGAYGVILIRTKRGNSAKPQIDFFNGYESEYSSASSRCVGGTGGTNVPHRPNSTKRHVSVGMVIMM